MQRELDRRWLWAGAFVFLSLAAWEVLWLRPGLGAPEELVNFAYAQAPGDTWRWWLRLGGGALHRALISVFTAGPWPWQSVYAYNLLALGLLASGLWRWGKTLGGEAAAVVALVLAMSAPFSFLQARTTFAYVLLPGLSLWLAWGLCRFKSVPASALLGVACGLACLDYDAWLIASVAMGAVWAAAPSRERARFWPAALGLGLALAAVYALSAPFHGAWSAQRSNVAPALAANLKSYFLGGLAPKAMGLEQLPAFPWLAWPGLLLALRVGPAWLWVWALLGLAPLWLGGPQQEPNRAIVAWPALLLLSAIGWAAILAPFKSSIRRTALGLALIAAPCFGYWQFGWAIERWDAPIHGLSRRLFEATEFLKTAPEGSNVVLRLDARDSVVLDRFTGGHGKGWVLMPPDLADPGDARWGLWQGFGPADGKRTWLLLPSVQALPRLEAAGQSPAVDLSVDSLPDGPHLTLLRERAKVPRSPLVASLEEAQRVLLALRLGQVQPDDLVFSLSDKNLSRGPLQQITGAFAGTEVSAKAQAALQRLAQPGERWRRLPRP